MWYENGMETRDLGGKMVDKVEELAAHFIAHGPATQEQARKLVINVTKRFLAAYNDQEKIKPYLKNNQLSSKDVKLRIKFRKKEYLPFEDGSVDEVQLENDQITYFKLIPPKPYSEIVPWTQISFARETFPEAVDLEFSIKP
jgi:hypothetical protein